MARLGLRMELAWTMLATSMSRTQATIESRNSVTMGHGCSPGVVGAPQTGSLRIQRELRSTTLEICMSQTRSTIASRNSVATGPGWPVGAAWVVPLDIFAILQLLRLTAMV